MRVRLKALFLLSAGVLLISIGSSASGQISLPGFGQKNAGSNDQKAKTLLHQHLPLDLDANSAYPTVPNEDLLGGPFRGRVLPITLDTLTKPLPPGDYVLPMTFFCSEYSIHRPGAGTAYVLAPAKGTAAKAISTLLWRGMLTGHKPQELQSVSWAIQGSVAYDKMPANYKRLVDELIPDMKNQVNGQAFADIEDGFQGKVNKATRNVSEKLSRGLGSITGGRGRVDIKVDVELNESFQRLGRLGKMALDGESINSIVTAANLTDSQREQALYAGQGSQSPPLPAANGPWSVIVPGIAYMRFVVHGGNLQSDNVMQIRILRPSNTTTASDGHPHLVLAQYSQNTPPPPSLTNLFNGSLNQTELSKCHATGAQPSCPIQATSFGGLDAYAVGMGSQVSIMTVAQPVQGNTSPAQYCVKKVIYEPTRIDNDEEGKPLSDRYGLCIYLAVVKDIDNSCGDSQRFTKADNDDLNWVQTFQANADEGCTAGVPHKDPCTPSKDKKRDLKIYGPLYRPDQDEKPGGNNSLYTNGDGFDDWKHNLTSYGQLELLFRDIPSRSFTKGLQDCVFNLKNRSHWLSPGCTYSFATVPEDNVKYPTRYAEPPKPDSYTSSRGSMDNYLRLVRFNRDSGDLYHFNYTPLIEVQYGYQVDQRSQELTVYPLYIGGKQVPNTGGTINLTAFAGLKPHSKTDPRPTACWLPRQGSLGDFPINLSDFPYKGK